MPKPYMWHLFHWCFVVHFLQLLSQMLVQRPLPPDTGQSSAGHMSEGGCKPCVYNTSRMLLLVPWYNSTTFGSSLFLSARYLLKRSYRLFKVGLLIALIATTFG